MLCTTALDGYGLSRSKVICVDEGVHVGERKVIQEYVRQYMSGPLTEILSFLL